MKGTIERFEVGYGTKSLIADVIGFVDKIEVLKLKRNDMLRGKAPNWVLLPVERLLNQFEGRLTHLLSNVPEENRLSLLRVMDTERFKAFLRYAIEEQEISDSLDAAIEEYLEGQEVRHAMV